MADNENQEVKEESKNDEEIKKEGEEQEKDLLQDQVQGYSK